MQEADKLRREIETLRARLVTMSEVNRRITESLDLDTVLQRVVDGARSLTGARYGALGIFDDSGRIRDWVTSGLAAEERRRTGDLEGLLGFLNEVQEPLRLSDDDGRPRSASLRNTRP